MLRTTIEKMPASVARCLKYVHTVLVKVGKRLDWFQHFCTAVVGNKCEK